MFYNRHIKLQGGIFMTEMETMERAKMYLDKLANGIDPLTDQPVKDEDVVNQVRISRCLFYVSDVLRQVIANGGIRPAAAGKVPFVYDPEAMKRVEFSQTPLRIVEFCKRISGASGREGTVLSYAPVCNWLEHIGMLEKRQNAEGKMSRMPTEQGNQIGIFVEERQGPQGMYTAVLYTEEAQRFIVDNLPAILENK